MSSSITSWALTIPASCDLSGHQLVGASKWIGNASGEYKWNLDNGFEPYVTASYAFRSKAVGSVEDSDYGPIPSYAEVNFSTGLRAATTGSPGCSVSAPAPPAPAPLAQASANAAYLKNPAPEYPSLVQRRGWEGTVLLRVHVLASGKPGEIQIAKSSGRQQLGDAALNAVKRWSCVPAKQGDVAQDGWVSVPIDFKIH